MASWKYLVRFIAAEDEVAYYTSFTSGVPKEGEKVESFPSIEALEHQTSPKKLTIQKVYSHSQSQFSCLSCKTNSRNQITAPITPTNPIVCIGLNYANHAKEASVSYSTRKQCHKFWKLTRLVVIHSNQSSHVV